MAVLHTAQKPTQSQENEETVEYVPTKEQDKIQTDPDETYTGFTWPWLSVRTHNAITVLRQGLVISTSHLFISNILFGASLFLSFGHPGHFLTSIKKILLTSVSDFSRMQVGRIRQIKPF